MDYNYDRTRDTGIIEQSRQEKILAARASFHCPQTYAAPRERQSKHSFRLLRVMTTGMLFLILVIAFSNGFSYHGFNKNYVQQQLNSDAHWQMVEKVVQNIYHNNGIKDAK